MFRHIVLFRIHDDVSDTRVTDAINELRSLAALPGVRSWVVELSLDERKGRVVVEDATFSSADAFRTFHAHPRHVQAGKHMSLISDWWNGDYLTSPPGLPVEAQQA